MILPVLAAIAVQAVVRYAVKEGLGYIVDKAKDAVIQKIMDRARKLAEARLLEVAKEECPTCDPEDVIKSMKDPCASLNRGSGSGKYRGGSHGQMTKPVNDGLDSHHIPAKSNYPTWRQKASVYNKWPAVQMEPSDHKQTFSYGRGAKARAYAKVQQAAFKKYGILGAFALDAAEIKLKFGDKYDQALMEAGAYTACVAAFPDKYKLKKTNGRRRRR